MNTLSPMYNTLAETGGEPVCLRYIYLNGYGVSIVRHAFSYGGKEGLFELAVLHGENLCYGTAITGDVLGWLTKEDCIKLGEAVSELPMNRYCRHKNPLR